MTTRNNKKRTVKITIGIGFLIVLLTAAAVLYYRNSRYQTVHVAQKEGGTITSILDTLRGSTVRTPKNFTVAYIGDQGLTENSKAVLQLIKSENTGMVIHVGDFDYQDNPDAWDSQITSILGADFPYFAAVGNHDLPHWQEYQQKLKERLDRIEGEECSGTVGEEQVCTYKGIFFILSGVGTVAQASDQLFTPELQQSDAIWKICGWHKNQQLMQIEQKTDEVGWGPYEDCRKEGAMIVTGHAHIYARTHLMSNFQQQTIASTSETLTLERGKSLAVVTGIAGYSIRDQVKELAEKPWWAAKASNQQQAQPGALFCQYNYEGVENEARCYFKQINGTISDQFILRSAIRE